MIKRLVAGFAVAALWAGCSPAREQVRPFETGELAARVLRMDPLDPSEYRTKLEIVLRVKNPSATPVVVKKADIEVSYAGDSIVDGDELGAGDYGPGDGAGDGDAESDEPTPGSGGDEVEVNVWEGSAISGEIVAGGSHVDIPITVSITYPEDPRAYVAFCKLGIAHLDVEGTVQTDKGPLTIADVGEFPTPTLPEPTAEEVQVASANNGQSGDLGMVLRLYNANTFSWKIRDWNYKIYVGGKMMREATVGVAERIQPNTAIQYGINVPLNEKTFGPDVRQLLKSDTIPYRVVGTLRFGDVVIPTNFSSQVNFSR